MEKECQCGVRMEIRLRTVVFQNKVDIENVPIFSCDQCGSSEIYPSIKSELKRLIAELGELPMKQKIRFEDTSEMANLLLALSHSRNIHKTLEILIEERINELLDILILAQSLDDSVWTMDVRNRLHQIHCIRTRPDAAVS